MNSRVLVFSRDPTLVQTRQLILGAFFETRGAERIREVEALIVTQAFDLIILCYTLSENDRQRVLDLVMEQKPRPEILVLTAAGYKSAGHPANTILMTESGPYHLLKKTAEILGVDLRARASDSAAAAACK